MQGVPVAKNLLIRVKATKEEVPLCSRDIIPTCGVIRKQILPFYGPRLRDSFTEMEHGIASEFAIEFIDIRIALVFCFRQLWS